jgi:hypothetical protein
MTAPIKPLGDETRHYWLAVGMAKATGVDLQQALQDGRITHGDWADLVQRCRGCAWAEGCKCWMADQDPGGAAVPLACPNADLFEAVLAGQDQGGSGST